MKRILLCLAFPALMLANSAVQAGGFQGLYLGAKVGENSSRFSGGATILGSYSPDVTLREELYPTSGLEVGYNTMSGNLVVGVSGFIDFNGNGSHPVVVNGNGTSLTSSYSSTVTGGDVKLGYAAGSSLAYVKVGYADAKSDGGLSGSGSGTHFGLGAEFQFTQRVTFSGELSDHEVNSNGGKLHNTNFTIGLNFYLE